MNAHDRLGEPAIELAVPLGVRAEARRDTRDDHLERTPERVARLSGRIDGGNHALFDRRVDAAKRPIVGQRACFVGGDEPSGWQGDIPDGHHVARDVDLESSEQLTCHGADGNAGGCFTRARTLEHVANVVVVVLDGAGEVCMAGTRARHGRLASAGRIRGHAWLGEHRLLPVHPILVADQQRDRRPGCRTLPHPREDLGVVAFNRHPAAAPIAALPTPELRVDRAEVELEAGGHAVERRDEGLPVRLTSGEKPQHRTRLYTEESAHFGGRRTRLRRFGAGRALAAPGGMTPFDTMLDLLDHGCDGEPRWIVLDAANAHEASSLVRLVSTEAERRGYLPLSAERFAGLAPTLPDGQGQRTFALLQTCRAPAAPDPSVLVAAAVLNPRPHVLVTITIAANPRTPLFVREARSAYAPVARRALPSPTSAEGLKHLARAEAALDHARRGRHEPGVRMMREAFAALLRREENGAASRVAIMLGRVLLERGCVAAAERAFAEAAAAVQQVCAGHAARARVWLALARTDNGCLTDAESVLRAIKLSGALDESLDRQWANAALARCLIWQDRHGEAIELVDGYEGSDPDEDAFLAVNILAIQVRTLLAAGRTFDAGQRARAAVERAVRSKDAFVELIAHTAHLRVLGTTGDLELVSERLRRVLSLAAALHAPLRAVRARVVWAGMLRRAGLAHEAAGEIRRLQRISRAVPQTIRRSIEALCATDRRTRVPQPDGTPLAVALLRAAQDEPDDRTAARTVLDRFVAEARAARVDLQSAAGGALSSVLTSGAGLAPGLGERSLEAGIIVGPERRNGAWELAVPVRSGHRLLGAVAGRWPPGRDPHPRAADWLELVTAVLAPRLELMLAERADAARATTDIPELIGTGAAMTDVRRTIARAASAPFTVLIAGESGAGKELVARAIHHLSARRDRRFCDVNCAALPDELIESELFGHAKGAFTGALVERPGLFEEANGGTLFLDELPDLSLRAQAKLLRVLQQGEIRRVGESFTRRVDVRLVTATNRDMAREVSEGRFRQDLLYRIDVIRIHIPPLRERPEDVPLLARHFWATAAQRAGTRSVLSHGVLAALAQYHWPGNVRELQNVVAALAVAAPSRGLVRPTLLPSAVSGAVSVSSARLQDAREQFERRFVEVALARAGGSRTRAAAQLGISRQGLLKLMARLKFESS
jgi:DNA-binding NtrC family response regulator